MSDTLSLSNALSRSSLLDKIANPTSVNPLAAYANAMQVAHGVWANRQAQAEQAAGEAAQGAIDADGNFVPTTANRNLVAAGPAAALAAQEAIKNNQALQGAQIDQAGVARKLISNELGPLMALPDDQLGKGITSAAARLRAARIPEALIDQTLLNMPNDPAGQRQYLNQLRLQLAGPEQLQTNLPGYGTLGTVTGPDGRQYGTVQSPQGGISVPPQPGAGQGPAPGTMVEVSDAAGNKYLVPFQTLYPGGAPGTGNPGTGNLGTGRPPPSLRNPNAPGGGAAPASAPAPGATAAPAPAPSGPAPDVPPGAQLTQVSPATEEENKGAAAHAVAAREAANSYQTRIQPVEGALTALAGADTGKGGEVLNTIRAYVQDVSPAFIQRMLPSSLTDQAARTAYDEAVKYTTGMAINAPGGARSNAGQEAAGAATPSVHISNEAARLVTRAILAQLRMQQTATLLFNNSRQPAANYDRFTNSWMTGVDPRAFAADKMTNEERAAMVKDMGGVRSAAYARFKKSYKDGIDAGVIPNHAG